MGIDIDTLSVMTRQYLEAALWSSYAHEGDKIEEESPLDNHFSVADFALSSVDVANQDCEAFKAKAREAGVDVDALDDEDLGHDFWLTRNRHGAGFWDGDYEDAVGKKLTEIAHTFGECNAIIGDDENIHLE